MLLTVESRKREIVIYHIGPMQIAVLTDKTVFMTRALMMLRLRCSQPVVVMRESFHKNLDSQLSSLRIGLCF